MTLTLKVYAAMLDEIGVINKMRYGNEKTEKAGNEQDLSRYLKGLNGK
jgi:hypothetical protein